MKRYNKKSIWIVTYMLREYVAHKTLHRKMINLDKLIKLCQVIKKCKNYGELWDLNEKVTDIAGDI